MHIDPLLHVERNAVKQVLGEQLAGLQRVQSHHGDVSSRLSAYVQWAAQAGRRLGHCLRQQDVRRLVWTDQYRLIVTGGPGLIMSLDTQRQTALNDLINAE